jgi:hypothetical protein
MELKKLEKLRQEHARLSSLSVVKTADLVGLAGQLGRQIKPGVGKHPMYENKFFPELPNLSIPQHGADTDMRLARSILRQLENQDLVEWELTLEIEDK